LEFEPTLRPCDDASGALPDCAPLAVPVVPVQQKNSKRYNQLDALANGTLFPGLNLPFHLKTAPSSLVETAALELQALCFVLTELGLYLDTHPDDGEAFELYKEYVAMECEGRKRYEAMYGPITQTATASSGSYVWLNNPWPWEMPKGGEK